MVLVGVAYSIFMATGCTDDDISPLQNLEFRLAIFNGDMERVTSLEEGINFYIGLELINNSADTVVFSYSDSRRLMAQFFSREDFLFVYRRVGVALIPAGKPYNPEIPLNFIDANLPPTKIHPFEKSEAILGFSWSSNSANQPLSIGNYYSSFEDKAVIENIEIDINTTIEFEIR